jgi:putative phage-type endonuclease
LTTATRPGPVELVPASADRREWLAARRDGIGASEIAAVLGISPWESPFSLYWRKVNGWAVDINDEMSAGIRAESVIAGWFADQHPEYVVHPSGLYANRERPWQLATPDRVLCDAQMHDNPFPDDPTFDWHHYDNLIDALVECKYVVHGWEGWGEPGTDEIPVHYRAQGLWQADVMGVDEVYFAAWHGATFREYLVRRDETDLRMMREAGRRFMARIENDDPPSVDEHAATLATMKKLHPDLDDRAQEVDAATAAGYRRARALKTHATALCDRYEARLRAEMGDAKRAVCDGQTVATRVISDIAERTQTVAAHRRDYLLPPRPKKAS